MLAMRRPGIAYPKHGTMLAIFLKTLPFFALIGLGWGAGRRGFFNDEATGYLTRFVFYFALSAMLFRFSANLKLSEVLDWGFVAAYLIATTALYILATLVARWRGEPVPVAAFEAQCAVIGNVGFLGLPMLGALMGERAIVGIMQMLAVDLLVFSSLAVIIVTASREGHITLRALRNVGLGLVKNPMVDAVVLGFSVDADPAARVTASNEGVQIQVYDIIYKLLEDVEKALKGLLGPVYEEVVIGRAEVRQIFNIRSVGVIAGCYMRTGVARRNAKVRVIRQANLIHVGSVSSLRHLQDNVREVRTGFEFGVSIDKWNDVQQGDLLEFFVMSQTEQ